MEMERKSGGIRRSWVENLGVGVVGCALG